MVVMKGESYTRRVNKLKEEVRMMLDKMVDPTNYLELIDILQKLGLSYHFEDEIKKLIKSIYNNVSNNDTWIKRVCMLLLSNLGSLDNMVIMYPKVTKRKK